MTLVRFRVLGLVAALLWAQWLGLSHAIWHSPLLRGGDAHSAWAAKPTAKTSSIASDSAGPLSHASDAQCRLFDQLAHSDALIPDASNWAVSPPLQPCLAIAPISEPIGLALAYSARAPPAFLS